jgi:hypothetical protein
MRPSADRLKNMNDILNFGEANKIQGARSSLALARVVEVTNGQSRAVARVLYPGSGDSLFRES